MRPMAGRAESLRLAQLLGVSAELGGPVGSRGGASARPPEDKQVSLGSPGRLCPPEPWHGDGRLLPGCPAGSWWAARSAGPACTRRLAACQAPGAIFSHRPAGQGRSRGVQGLRTVADPDTSSEPRGPVTGRPVLQGTESAGEPALAGSRHRGLLPPMLPPSVAGFSCVLHGFPPISESLPWAAQHTAAKPR